MAWSGGTYTRTNGTYTGALVWTSDAGAAVKIRADRHDTHDQDLAAGINNCLTKDGQNTPTANIAWGSFRITALGNGVAATDAATFGQTITAFTFDSGSKIVTATRATGNLTFDLSALAGGGGAPVDAQYLVGAMSGGLSAERLLSGASGRVAVDYGTPGAAVVDLGASGVSPGTYNLATVTVDAYGRITSASAGSAGAGTVTSVNAGGGTTGFTFTGGPVTSSGSLTLAVSDASVARTALGIGTVATQGANDLVVSERTQTVAASSTTSINLASGQAVILTQAVNITSLSFTSVPAGAVVVTIRRVKDATATPRTITWPASVKWPGAVAPTLTSTTSAVDIISLLTMDGGTNWAGVFSLDSR